MLSNSGVPAVYAMWTLDGFFGTAICIAYFVDIPRGISARDKSLHKRRWVKREPASSSASNHNIGIRANSTSSENIEMT